MSQVLRPNFSTTCHQLSTHQELLSIVEVLCGLTDASSGSAVQLLFPFLLPLLQSCVSHGGLQWHVQHVCCHTDTVHTHVWKLHHIPWRCKSKYLYTYMCIKIIIGDTCIIGGRCHWGFGTNTCIYEHLTISGEEFVFKLASKTSKTKEQHTCKARKQYCVFLT